MRSNWIAIGNHFLNMNLIQTFCLVGGTLYVYGSAEKDPVFKFEGQEAKDGFGKLTNWVMSSEVTK